MSDCFSEDNQDTASRDIATLAVYLGYSLERISVAPDGGTTFVIRCPKFDFEQVVREAADPLTNVEFVGIAKVNAFIGSRLSAARKMTVWQRTDGQTAKRR